MLEAVSLAAARTLWLREPRGIHRHVRFARGPTKVQGASR